MKIPICSQEEALHTHLAHRKIAEQTGISRSSIRRMIKRRTFRQFEMVKTPEMNDGCRNRRYARAISISWKVWTQYPHEKQYGKMKKILPLTFLLTYKMNVPRLHRSNDSAPSHRWNLAQAFLKKFWSAVSLNMYNGLPFHLMWIHYIISFGIL